MDQKQERYYEIINRYIIKISIIQNICCLGQPASTLIYCFTAVSVMLWHNVDLKNMEVDVNNQTINGSLLNIRQNQIDGLLSVDIGVVDKDGIISLLQWRYSTLTVNRVAHDKVLFDGFYVGIFTGLLQL